MTHERAMSLLDSYIDYVFSIYPVKHAIEYLLDHDFAKEELIELNVSEEDIDAVLLYY